MESSVKYPLIIIGGGLSGLAAAVRCSRYVSDILLVEKHNRLGGLNSYYYRNKRLFETGLHAITNYAEATAKKAPLNKLLRQLKIKRSSLSFCPQKKSEILFYNQTSLLFSNDFELLRSEIEQKFPTAAPRFDIMLQKLALVNPFNTGEFVSAKSFLLETLQDKLLTEMLLCPLMYYGSSVENDMDLGQFSIMFQAIFREGMFRPDGTIKDFIDILKNAFLEDGGTLRKNCDVTKIITEGSHVKGIELASGDIIEADYVLSTIGHHETLDLLGNKTDLTEHEQGRLGFIESIFELPREKTTHLPKDTTITFFNTAPQFSYQQTQKTADIDSGVICFPQNFSGLSQTDTVEVRSTHLASFAQWRDLKHTSEQAYQDEKKRVAAKSAHCVEKFIGTFYSDTVYQDTFTPLTIKRYTSKIGGAIYGSPTKIKDGDIGFTNLFLAGTDQGFLGIVGSMLSGVSIVNQHILPKL